MRASSRLNPFLQRARGLFPPDALLTEDDQIAPYGSDWTRLPGKPGLVFLPRDVSEVAAFLKLCSEMKVPVVPSGGRTGLAGGATAPGGEAVLSLSRMNRIGEVDVLGRTVRVQAGAVTQAVHEHCRPHGLIWPIDLAAKGTSQIGGNLATNAGGLRVIRYGMARRWVSAIQAVTMAGDILELNRGLEKNNTGFDLVQLLCGSEGTLAVITEATLKLTRVPDNTVVMLFGVESLSALVELFHRTRQGPFEISAFEFFSRACHDAVERQLGRRARFSQPYAYYALVEVELLRREADNDALDGWLGSVLESAVVGDGTLGRSSEEIREIWMLREGITESLQKTSSRIRKFDVSVAVSQLGRFVADIQAEVATGKYELQLYVFGHLGDGSPHLNLVKPPNVGDDAFDAACGRFEPKLFEMLKAAGGSASAEHGVGVQKKAWVRYSRSAEELRLFHAIKRAFDPHGLLNPGKLIDT